MPKSKPIGKVALNTIHYLESVKDPKVLKHVLRTAPNSVLKYICNAALNTEQGPITLSKKQKRRLGENRKEIHFLTSRKVPFQQKRKVFQKGGGWLAAIPLILSAVAPIANQLLKLKEEQE